MPGSPLHLLEFRSIAKVSPDYWFIIVFVLGAFLASSVSACIIEQARAVESCLNLYLYALNLDFAE